MRETKNNSKKEDKMTNRATQTTLEGIIEHLTNELVEALEFHMDKENGLGMSIQNSIIEVKKTIIVGSIPWKNALTIVFGRGN